MSYIGQAEAGGVVLPYRQGRQQLYGDSVNVALEGQIIFIEPSHSDRLHAGLAPRAEVISSEVAKTPLLEEIHRAHYPESSAITVRTAAGINEFANRHFAPFGAASLRFVQTDVPVEMPPEDYVGLYLPRGEMALGSSTMFLHDVWHAIRAMALPSQPTQVYIRIADEVSQMRAVDLARAQALAGAISKVFDYNVSYSLGVNPETGRLRGISLLGGLLNELHRDSQGGKGYPEFLDIVRRLITESGFEVKDGIYVPEETQMSTQHYQTVHQILQGRPDINFSLNAAAA